MSNLHRTSATRGIKDDGKAATRGPLSSLRQKKNLALDGAHIQAEQIPIFRSCDPTACNRRPGTRSAIPSCCQRDFSRRRLHRLEIHTSHELDMLASEDIAHLQHKQPSMKLTSRFGAPWLEWRTHPPTPHCFPFPHPALPLASTSLLQNRPQAPGAF